MNIEGKNPLPAPNTPRISVLRGPKYAETTVPQPLAAFSTP